METRKKILYVITKGVFGGAGRNVFDLATRANELYDVSLAAGGSGPLVDELEIHGVTTYTIPSITRDIGLLKEIKAFLEIRTILKTVRPDVLHLHSSKAGLLGALAGRTCGIAHIIYTAHGWPFHEKRNVLWRCVAWLGSYLTTLCVHKVICVSQFDAKRAHMPLLKHKLTVIHPGVTQSTTLDRQDARKTLFTAEEQKLHIDALWVVSNAELTQNKNLLYAIDAVTSYNHRAEEYGLQKIYYSILGEGEDRKKLEAHITEFAMQADIKLHGYVHNARIYLGAFDIFFLPSKKEGLPYAILEAGLSGVPTIASEVGGIPEIVEDGKYGLLIDPFDVPSAVDAFEQFATNVQMRDDSALALKQHLKENFSVERMFADTLLHY